MEVVVVIPSPLDLKVGIRLVMIRYVEVVGAREPGSEIRY